MERDYTRLYTDLGVRISSVSSTEVSAFCPVHNDVEKPSFSFNTETGLYKCFVPTCAAFSGGNYEKFCAIRATGGFKLSIPELEIEQYHQALLKNSSVLKWVKEVRGLTIETITKYKLGYDGERLWIPIKEDGVYVNVRKHAVNKKTRNKTISYGQGFGRIRLWPTDTIKMGDRLLLCEGELDCLLANQLGFTACTVTGGAGSWEDEFNSMLSHASEIDIVYDIDLAGRAGANLICKRLAPTTKCIKDILLPITTPANGDITDYVVTYGNGREEIEKLINDAEPFELGKNDEKITPQIAVKKELSEISHPGLLGRRVQFKGTINGIDATPYVSPKTIAFRCAFHGKFKFCVLCPLHHSDGKIDIEIAANSQDVLRSIDVTEDQQKIHFRKVIGIYPACQRWTFSFLDSYTLYDARIIPEISYQTSIDTEYVMSQAFISGHKIKSGHVYDFEGTPYANPKNQYLTLLLDRAEPVKDDIDNFELTEIQKNDLKVFQVTTTVKDKMFEIARDLSYNVTRIYEREKLIIACDLVFHSSLSCIFQGRWLPKGRVDLLVIGDTRCGKSETFITLVNHYMAGEIITGENTSHAGLVGGTQQIGSRWLTTWGKLPMNDRRLLIIDEISGMSVEDIGQMSGVRSSGIAEITKIQSEKIFARTRAIWSGNPRGNKGLTSYDTGIQAVKELIGRPEDIARFDLAIALMSGEVSLDIINRQNQMQIEHKYTTERCHQLIMWAWSRKPSQICITPEAERYCLRLATEMSLRYSSIIPLIEGAEQRVKLARMAVACAMRVFSTEDGETVIVKPEHVQFVHDFLEESYSGQGLNYLSYSKVKLAEQQLKNEGDVRGLLLTFGNTLIDSLLEHQYFRMTDLEDVLNMDKKEIRPVVTQLLKQRAIKHHGTALIKTPAFISLLRTMQNENHKEVKVDF